MPPWLRFNKRGVKAVKRTRKDEYKSGLERDLALLIEASGQPVQYEPFRIPYVPAKPKHYKPDFLLKNGILIEGKGYFESSDRAKIKACLAQHPDLDIRFVFSTPHKTIGKKSKTTYAQWASYMGCQWADRTIPESWY